MSGVQAVLTGPVTETLVCQLEDSNIYCTWPATDPVVTGDYSLQVTAPGYETQSVHVQVSVGPRDYCGCSDQIAPASVSLVLISMCPASIDSWYSTNCPSDAECRLTWAEVLANPICVPPSNPNYNGRDEESLGTCGDYDVAMYAHSDWELGYYYDHATGQLVEVFSYYSIGTAQGQCVGGPPGGIPTCPSTGYTNACTRDGGTDGAPLDGAVDAGSDARD
jgi:hypothetical protein